MDDSNIPSTYKPSTNLNKLRHPLGMSSFGPKERAQFGHKLRLAMACIETPPEPTKGRAIPDNETSIRQRIKSLSQDITSQHADLLALLVKFDDLEGWKTGGTRHCAAWMNIEIGISLQLSWEYLRVGRKLQLLPTLNALFRAGKLSWSKVRLISRVADQESEPLLCHAALDASVSDVKRICDTYRWGEASDCENKDKDENDRACQQWNTRSLTWSEISNGSTLIQLVLPPEIAQAFLNSVEHSMNQLDNANGQLSNTDYNNIDYKMSQRRADAAVLMAETSLQSAGKAIATADRYQVIVSVDAAELPETQSGHRPLNHRLDASPDNASSAVSCEKLSHTSTYNNYIPTKRPTLNGAGPIARETARRITCDCSVSIHKTISGEPVDISRKSRVWPTAMERAIKERDQHCVWPGCTQSRHLHIHHIKHWADGGETSVSNGVCLCSHHHTLVHEGGYTIQRIDNDEHKLNDQFVRQQRITDITMFDFETTLRNSTDSFNAVRKLSPTRYRFRIVNAQGNDILDQPNTRSNDANNRPAYQPHLIHQSILQPCESAHESTPDTLYNPAQKSALGNEYESALDNKHESTHDSTRIECREPFRNGYYIKKQISCTKQAV